MISVLRGRLCNIGPRRQTASKRALPYELLSLANAPGQISLRDIPDRRNATIPIISVASEKGQGVEASVFTATFIGVKRAKHRKDI
uniref:Uncharacterized protein n=1 Tax=Candidatus Kentrum sp. TC TaxID=2126339 RepID=A0A451AFG6_9GAMM|nr:MAG: hypothetical protein BECKTC1821F_GA0114240_11455 [Candidatus Kentron sp. TC]